ncbi:MAG: hypothetical protein K8T20_00245 [Planctomycetes bacterium]|nr:hypothetical protein [Planctomycetota bacterium]
MNPKVLWVFAVIYFTAAIALAMASVFNFRRGVTGFGAALAAGTAYAIFRGVMVVRKARQLGGPGAH